MFPKLTATTFLRGSDLAFAVFPYYLKASHQSLFALKMSDRSGIAGWLLSSLMVARQLSVMEVVIIPSSASNSASFTSVTVVRLSYGDLSGLRRTIAIAKMPVAYRISVFQLNLYCIAPIFMNKLILLVK